MSISKGKGDIKNCGMHRGAKQLKRAMKFDEMAFEKRFRKIVTIDDMLFSIMYY